MASDSAGLVWPETNCGTSAVQKRPTFTLSRSLASPRLKAAAADPAIAGDDPVPLSALAGAGWATARAGTAYADMFTRICRSFGGFEPDIRHRVNDLRLLLEFVARGSAAIVPALGEPARNGRVVVRPISEADFSRAIFVAVRDSDRARPSTSAVVAAISR
jgi:DNA-binding transcriptional LysR family regulator